MKTYRANVMICAGTACVSNHSLDVRKAFEEEIKKRDLEDEVQVVTTGCNGFCGAGPIVVIQPDGIFYQFLKPKDVPYLVEEHLLKGRPVKKLMYVPPEEEVPIPKMNDINFFSGQMLVALRNRGMIDPEKIDDYIARDGYSALVKVLTTKTPDEVIEEIKASALRGRGGGGFPAGIKWETCKRAEGEPKYVICNADEGDPGAFMDRSIIEGDPHSVLEGMAIGAYAIGVSQGYIYVRMEYPLAIERFKIALKQAREYGLLGKNILDTGFDFDVDIRRGAGAFVCGESTALMASVEGRIGEPRAKYIHTVEHGLWNRPTCLNNVETWANVPVIILQGAEWFTSIGTGDVSENPWGGSKGTKVFSLAGKINNTGLVEVPMGITLRKLVYDVGGGIPKGRKFKAVQTGGPSGGFIPEELLDLQVDFEQLDAAGSIMGSGGMVIMDESNCMVSMALYFIEFLVGESCGKCTPCREGLRQLRYFLKKIINGEGTVEDLEEIEIISETMQKASLCGLGKSAPNPVLSTLKYFRDEYIAHIEQKKCPAGSCRALIKYEINESCIGCLLCKKQCPENAISGESKKLHIIDQDKCTNCGVCFSVCPVDSIDIISGGEIVYHHEALEVENDKETSV
ncbi:MAG: NADH-quinone oxidoreductase subunit NuoF [Candidatus Hatepunaea meridiana]|nr:NADH-quinone oxidoreductase subunit NuoF [Candidatus Hatepunaea meridiana]